MYVEQAARQGGTSGPIHLVFFVIFVKSKNEFVLPLISCIRAKIISSVKFYPKYKEQEKSISNGRL